MFRYNGGSMMDSAKVRESRRQDIFDNMLQQMGMAQKQKRWDDELELKKREMASDPKKKLRDLALKKNLGQSLSPEEEAFIRAESQIQGQKMGFDPLTRQPYTMPSLEDRIFGEKRQAPPSTFDNLAGQVDLGQPSAEVVSDPTGMANTPAGRMERYKTNEDIRKKEAEVSAKTEQALNDQFIKDIYMPYQMGGSADNSKQIDQVSEISDRLENEDLTGGVKGYLPTWARGIFDEESVDAQEKVEEVVQRNLREVLGAQFTEKEGERLISRAYNPRLSEDINKQRIEALKKSMIEAGKAKQDAINYFEKNGTIKGWKGKMPSLQSIEESFDKQVGGEKQKNDSNTLTRQERALEILRQRGKVQ